MLPKIAVWSIFILPWITLFFMKKEIIKRYTPVATFSSLLVTLYNELSYTQHWFKLEVTITDALITFVPFTFGVFFVGTIWIFALTFERFWVYLISNIVADAFLAFVIRKLVLVPLGVIREIKYHSFQLFISSIIMALMLFVYQMWIEGVLIKTDKRSKGKEYIIKIDGVIRGKVKAK